MKRLLRVFSVLLVLSVIVSGCWTITGRKIVGGEEGTTYAQTKALGKYTKIDFEGGGDIKLVQGETHSLQIDARETMLEKINVKLEDETLYITFNRGFWRLPGSEQMVFTFTFVDLTMLKVAGGVKVEAESLTTESFGIELEGGVTGNLGKLDLESLTVEIDGGASLKASGKATSQTAKIAGAANYKMENLESQDVSLKIEGASNAEIWAVKTLDLDVSGAASVNYWGKPVVTQNVSGAVSIKDKGDK